MTLENHTIAVDSTIRDALELIDRIRGAICFIVDDDWRLVGTVSDGDIRRALLSGKTLESSVSAIMATEPIVASTESTRDDLLAIMLTKDIRDLPIVDSKGRLVSVREMRELLADNERDNLTVLMAGGRGQRLMPLTSQMPKPMLKVNDRPILELIIAKLVKQGFRRFLISVNYLSHIVKQHFMDGKKWGVEISYLQEERPLGTGGALGLMTTLPDQPFVLMNGDILTNLNVGHMIDYHVRENAMATVGVRDHEIQLPYGVFKTDGNHISSFHEKPLFTYSINAGIYTLSPEILDQIPKGEPFDMPDLIDDCIKQAQKVQAYHITESWLDVGEHSELERARREVELLL